MARPMWKGSISFGLVNIPISLYSADTHKELDFDLLDRRDLSRVHYVRVNDETGEEVPWEEVVKGYKYKDGRYVVLTEADFQQANPEATRTIDILQFVDADEIDPEFFEKPYYLAPAAGGEKAYALLRETLKRTEKVGIAKVVIRTREHLTALIPRGKMLELMVLRYAYEVRNPDEIETPGESPRSAGIREQELKMAEQLVESLSGAWKPEEFHDEYREDLLTMIKEKVKSGRVEEITEPKEEEEEQQEENVIDIMDLLKQSIEQKGKGGGFTSRRQQEEEYEEPRRSTRTTTARAARSVRGKKKRS